MPSDVVLLEHVSVRYQAPGERIRSFKEYAIRLMQGRIQYKEFAALNDISLNVTQGEILGLIGMNGAGKSTMLKVISRVLFPTEGRVRVFGKVAPLLELGAGFHSELTGRENIFLNGTLLGHTRSQIEANLESILDFAGLEGFIDAPLRTYSSGMMGRLGFAVATAWKPEILLVDEVLAVGDEAFQQKCLARLESYRASGTTTILVTHNMITVMKMCSRVALLEHGRLRGIGPAAEMVAEYRATQAGAG